MNSGLVVGSFPCFMKIRSHYLPVFLALASSLGLGWSEPPKVDLEKYRAAAEEKWEEDIVKLEARDAEESHPDDSILFVGSSSIRLWDDIVEDLSPYHPIQRGFGGSRFSDLAVYADRLIKPHRFRALVIFCANDIAGKENDKTPAEVAALFSYFRKKIREHNPEAPVLYIAVTPTPKRWEVWEQAKAANSAIRALCEADPGSHFIGTESLFLDGKGEPRPEFFIEDQLHLNRDGYAVWSAAVKSHLDSALNGAR